MISLSRKLKSSISLNPNFSIQKTSHILTKIGKSGYRQIREKMLIYDVPHGKMQGYLIFFYTSTIFLNCWKAKPTLFNLRTTLVRFSIFFVVKTFQKNFKTIRFQTKKSSDCALFSFTEQKRGNMDNNYDTGVVFLVLANTFRSTSHDFFVKKAENFNLSQPTF